MNDELGSRILELLDVLCIEVAATRSDVRGLDAKFTAKFDGLDAKVDRLDRRFARIETRVENVETELRLFRVEFERRIAPLERSG